MNKFKKLYFFSAAYPYGTGQIWKENEIEYLSKHFDKIVIIPLYYNNNNIPKSVPSNVSYLKPILGTNVPFEGKKDLFQIIDRRIFYYLKDLFKRKAFLNKRKIINWLVAIKRLKKILEHSEIRRIIKSEDNKSFYYFYWGVGLADIVPFLNKNKDKKIIVRLHGFDLFEYRNYGYIPFRSMLLKHSSLVLPCSNAGVEHLKYLYPKEKNKIQLQRLGTVTPFKPNYIYNRCRIVSVSRVIDLKRLELIIEALSFFKYEVEWTHIGDGPLLLNIKQKANLLPDNIKVNFMGFLDSDELMKELALGGYKLFVNVSKYEGVPVSIMEAFAIGIPVIATDVGGTSEIVDDLVGALLSPDINSEELFIQIDNVLKLDREKWKVLSENAYKRYLDRADFNKQSHKLLNTIRQLNNIS